MSLVLDASVTIARIQVEERTDAVLSVFSRVVASEAWVPDLWKLEIANVIESSVRKGKSAPRFRDEALSYLALLPIRVDLETSNRAWGETLLLAHRHRLTLYDAAYLELALRRNVPLATLDKELRLAATAEHVELLGL